MPDACCCSCDLIAGLARDHAGRLATLARREGAGPADALDVVQDALRTLLARPDAGSLCGRPDDAGRLLAAMVRNAARNLRRRHHRARPHVDIEHEPVAAREPPPDAAIDRARELAQLGCCMAELGDVHRRVVTLRVLEELPGDEVARALGLSAGHVAVLLHRARKQLERCMGA